MHLFEIESNFFRKWSLGSEAGLSLSDGMVLKVWSGSWPETWEPKHSNQLYASWCNM